jgi:predicted nicotinamide N-methyase
MTQLERKRESVGRDGRQAEKWPEVDGSCKAAAAASARPGEVRERWVCLRAAGFDHDGQPAAPPLPCDLQLVVTLASSHACTRRRMGPEASSDDSLAVFEDALFTLFDQPVIAHSAPPGAARYTFRHPALGGRQVELALPSPPPGLNSLQAQYVWPSSLLLADLLLREGGEIVLRPGETVVELGAGAGLGGLLAAVCLERAGGGGTVVSTDWGDTAILSALEENYRRNLTSQCSDPSSVRWSVVGHKWGEDVEAIFTRLHASSSPASINRRPRIDHLLLCDLLYYSAAHADLLKSVLALLQRPDEDSALRPKAHIAAGLHGGTSSAVERFVALAETAGCTVVPHGIFTWNARDDLWREVDPTREALTEGMVWRGTLQAGAIGDAKS